MDKVCLYCGHIFFTHATRSKFCNHSCATKYVKPALGKHWKLSKKTRKRQSVARLGIKLSDITKDKLRQYKGENTSNWKGGIASIPGYKRDRHLRNLEVKAGRERPQKCEICSRTGRICFDHCHKTNKFRGWICLKCNIILGLASDDIKILEEIIKYLRK